MAASVVFTASSGDPMARREVTRIVAPPGAKLEVIAALYTLLAQRAPSPIVELHRAVAVAMARVGYRAPST